MNLRALPKPQLVADVAFGIGLAVLYVGFSLALKDIQSEVNALFLASYALLGLGVLAFYLVFAANLKLALFLHVCIFPLFSALNLFLRWMPSAMVSVKDVQALSGLTLVYVLFLYAFFATQSILRKRVLERPAGEQIP